MATKPISATVITLNEADNITACVTALRQICAEVIVLDSNSSDETRTLAAQAGAVVHSQAYLGDGPQKAKAAEYASHDWILSMDADERPDDDLIEFIQTLDLEGKEQIAYAFRRKNFIGSHQIRAGSYYPDYVTRLYNRSQSHYSKVPGHSKVLAPSIQRTNCHIIHQTYTDLSHWIAKINHLTSRDAQGMYREGRKRKSPGGHAFAAFMRKYIFKGGFLQGQDGLTVAMTAAFSAYMKYLKLAHLLAEHEKNTD